MEQDAEFLFREPVANDGPAITALIAACPPLDANSAYCNLLQCAHFAPYCLVAEREGQVLGWVSGYRPPSDPTAFFVWQVAVSEAARGQRLARRMILALLGRAAVRDATHLITTITAGNRASWALFESLARHWDLTLESGVCFERNTHFAGAHPTEWQARLGPLPHRSA